MLSNSNFGHPPIPASETSSGRDKAGERGFCLPKSLSWLILIGTVVLTSVVVVVSTSVVVVLASMVVTVASSVVVFGWDVDFPSVRVQTIQYETPDMTLILRLSQ